MLFRSENTTVSFSLATNHNVSISIYDVVGREIAPVSNSDLSAGTYELPLSKGALNSGVYFIKLVVDARLNDGVGQGYSVTKKVIVQ